MSACPDENSRKLILVNFSILRLRKFFTIRNLSPKTSKTIAFLDIKKRRFMLQSLYIHGMYIFNMFCSVKYLILINFNH